MRRFVATFILAMAIPGMAAADVIGEDAEVDVGTVTDAVRVTLLKMGGVHGVQSVSGGGSSGTPSGCTWSLVFAPDLDDVPLGVSAGPKPHPDARFALLMCDGALYRYVWVAPDDVVDVDALARAEAERYVQDVLVPAVTIGVNPAARGLVGLRSWFWIDGFDGAVQAPPISAFGLTIDVRMSSAGIMWDFGDGVTEPGDLGRPYPEESTVQHAHQRDGTFTITASIDLAPEYRVDGGAWLPLDGLVTVASTTHDVEEREAIITRT